MSPAKIAIAAVVTITASAGTGAMKNVTGTSSAIAIAAVRPGIAPTKRPNSDDAMIRKITYGSASSFSAARRTSMAYQTIPSSSPRGSGTRRKRANAT